MSEIEAGVVEKLVDFARIAAGEDHSRVYIGEMASAIVDLLPEPIDPIREAAIAAIFTDIRDRKLLKYLFEEEPGNIGAYGYVEEPLELETQRECVSTWVDLVIGQLERAKAQS